MQSVEVLPLGSIGSDARFVLLYLDYKIISEHDRGKDALIALAKYALRAGDGVAVYRRTEHCWEKY